MKKLLLLSAVIAPVCFGAVTITKVKETELLKDTEIVTDVSGVASQESVDEALGLVGDVVDLVFGDDCRLISTYYNSVTRMPYLSLQFKMKDEEFGTNFWYKVWDELTRYNYIIDQHLPSNYYNKAQMDAALDMKADRAWGHYDSHTGGYAPDGFTWISSPKIAIAGGMAYQRIATTEGSVWVLESNGMTVYTGGETNGYFRISDDKGNAVFEITKGTEQVVGATAGSVRVENVGDKPHIFITYNVTSAEHPKLEICRDLKAKDWQTEDSENCPANVTWTGSTGAYVAEVWGKDVEERLFIQGTYKKGARDQITNSAPVAFTEIVIGGVTYRCSVGTATVDGSSKKVLVLE